MAGETRDPISGALRFNPMAVGPKLYGPNLSRQATRGPVDKAGYRERDARKLAYQRAIATWNPYNPNGR